MMTDEPVPLSDSIDVERLSVYLRSAVGLEGPIDLRQFPGGHSNLTYLASAGDRELVIKRAPPGPKAKSAHDMGREYAFLSRLNPFFRFAPRAYAYCDDEAIVGSAFCVLERITGVIVRRSFPPELLPELPPRQFNALIDTLADLHAVDVAVAGLAGLGRPEGYRRRQVEGWIKRLEAARTPTAGDFGKIVSWMVARMDDGPSPAAIVHNDFKLDNLVWSASDPAALIGVLDWEMATIGDPLMDLACTLSFWVSAEDPSQFRALRAMPTLHPGVPSRIEAAERYAARTKRPIDDLAFYECFGFFRRAVIEQQKYARFVRGDVNDSRFETLDRAVEVLRQMCLGVIERSPRV